MQPLGIEAYVCQSLLAKASHTQCKVLSCDRLQERNLHDSPIHTDSADAGIPPAGPLSSLGGEAGKPPRREKTVINASSYIAATSDNCKRIWQAGCTKID